MSKSPQHAPTHSWRIGRVKRFPADRFYTLGMMLPTHEGTKTLLRSQPLLVPPPCGRVQKNHPRDKTANQYDMRHSRGTDCYQATVCLVHLGCAHLVRYLFYTSSNQRPCLEVQGCDPGGSVETESVGAGVDMTPMTRINRDQDKVGADCNMHILVYSCPRVASAARLGRDQGRRVESRETQVNITVRRRRRVIPRCYLVAGGTNCP